MSKIDQHLKIAIAARYSSRSQNESSNDSQIKQCMDWYLSQVPSGQVFKIYTDQHTGTAPRRDQIDTIRRELKHENAKSSQPVTLLLWFDWDRWYREAISSVTEVGKFRDIGVEVNTMSRWCDYKDMNSLMMFLLEQGRTQSVSNDISKHTKRVNKQWQHKGYYPYVTSQRFMGRDNTGSERRNFWLPNADNLRQVGIDVANGMTIRAAIARNGGNAVLGDEESVREQLEKEINMARKGEFTYNFPPLWTESVWQKLQSRSKNKPQSTQQKSLSKYFGRGVLISPVDFGALTSDPAKSGKHAYYTRSVDGVCHCRYRVPEVNETLKKLVAELTFTANKQERLTKKAIQRSKDEKQHLVSKSRQLTKQLVEAEAMKKNAVILQAKGQFTADDRKTIENEYLKCKVELEQVNDLIKRHGEILETVLVDLQRIGVVLQEKANGLMLHHFLKTTFPDGLLYCPKSSTLRTSSMNAAFSLLGSQSVSSSLIKFGEPIVKTSPPVMGRRPVLVRTAQSDLQAYFSYLEISKKIA